MPDLPEQIVTEPEQLLVCCEYLAACPRFGFDTEFVGEDTYHPHLCLVQVATEDRLILIDPQSAGPLDAFWNVVTDPANLVVVHAGREEVRLCHLWTGRTPGNLFDLQIAAGLVGMVYPLGHAALVSQLLGMQLPKVATLTEWRSRPLTASQIRYAFDDVRYLLPLWRRLVASLNALGRAEWAREEFARLTAIVTQDSGELPCPVEKWRKLRGLGSLNRRRLAIVRQLYTWREETAAQTNRPARTVCRDDLLVEIARRNPSRLRDLQVIRGLPRRHLEAILQAIAKARTIPLEECPKLGNREQDPPQVAMATNILMAVLGDLCARQQLAANLVASTHDLKLLVRASLVRETGNTVPADSPLANGWRSQHVLPELMAVLEGRRSVRIANLAAESPLQLKPFQP